MHRFLERLDGAASTLVPLLYLAGLMLGTMAYFTGISLDAGLAVGVALATAAEVHAFLEQRRTRAAHAILARTPLDDPRREQLVNDLRLHIGILAALVVFSTYNSIAFVSATWHPTSSFLPHWLQVGIRGAIVPSLFLLTGALTPLSEDAGGLLARASHDMLHKTLRATLKQWRRRVNRADRSGLNLAPVAITLMVDAGDVDAARRIRLIDDGLTRAEQGPPVPAGWLPLVGSDAPERPPTGPGTPTIALDEPVAPRPALEPRRTAAALQLVEPRASQRKSRKRAPSPERRIRALLTAEPDLSAREIARRLRISESTAGRWKGTISAERADESGRLAQ
jgi:hypothetical protein